MYDITIDPRPIEEVNPMIYGQFIEFIENCIDGGIYDKGSRFSDEKGIRQDVLEKAKQLNPPILRWPGGTYVNTFHWMDSIGPLEQRKKRKNIIWGGIVDGGFGTAEFIEYCRAIGAEPMLCVNMASGTPEEAANWVEYCNGTEDTYFANLRRSHGYEEPFNVKYWCIGNESYAQPDLGIQHDVDVYIRDAWE
ncbi:MAG: alpha-N-arabinofuranosidase, partial [Thermoanaerobacteraceae bacterium]|nr:alpha-N-arabinofuranosidase [Thermoanaerobacteraceae bacterium]